MINHKRRRRSLNLVRVARRTVQAIGLPETLAALVCLCFGVCLASSSLNDVSHQPHSLIEHLLPDHSAHVACGHSAPKSHQSHLISAKMSPADSSSPVAQSSQHAASGGRIRTPRSIGDMFKKLFTSNKRSKQAQSNRNEWTDQQQIQQQQQLQQQQQQQQQQVAYQQQQQSAMAAQLAAAAANQHAVYASPFAAYSPQSAVSSTGLYSQFAPYSSPGLVAWPTTAGIAQALRATPTIIGAASAPSMALTSPAGPLYASASQTYNSYIQPPPQSIAAPPSAVAATQSAQSSAVASVANGNPSPAASHAHPSAVPPPPGMGGHSGGGSGSSMDFYQVLDALVRTSGFAPAGDQEAAAAQGYSSKSDATPVFSFKKLVSLPFYLSTEEKSLDSLANAMAPQSSGGGGYSLHPMLRRHVRRMSSPTSQQVQQQQLAAAQSLGNFMETQLQRSSTGSAPSERAQQQHYTNYFNALNNQLANNQLMQYFGSVGSHQQTSPMSAHELPGQASSASSPEVAAALANYQASLASLSQPSAPQYKRASSQMSMASSMAMPMAVQAPSGFVQQQAAQPMVSTSQQQDIQSLINSLQLAGSTGDLATYASLLNSMPSPATDGHRFGSFNGAARAAGGLSSQQQLMLLAGGNENTNNYNQLDYSASAPVASSLSPLTGAQGSALSPASSSGQQVSAPSQVPTSGSQATTSGHQHQQSALTSQSGGNNSHNLISSNADQIVSGAGTSQQQAQDAQSGQLSPLSGGAGGLALHSQSGGNDAGQSTGGTQMQPLADHQQVISSASSVGGGFSSISSQSHQHHQHHQEQ